MAAEAKITLTVDGVKYAVDAMGNVSTAANQAMDASKKAGEAIVAQGEKLKQSKADTDQAAAAAERFAALWGSHSSKLVQDAQGIAIAVSKVGAETMTAADAARNLKTLDAAMEHLEKTSQPVPAHFKSAADALRAMHPPAATLTSTLKDTAAALGLTFGAAAVVAGAKAFIGDVVEAASKINDLSAKLEVSVEATQRWSYAAKLTGSDIDGVGRSVGFMNKTLAGGDASTVDALNKAGLSFATIRAMKPETAFETIAAAIKNIPDPMTQAKVATELFGKAGQDLLPAIKEGFADIGREAPLMSKSTIDALDAAGDAWDRFKARSTAAAGTAMAALVLEAQEVSKGSLGFTDYVKALLTSGGSAAGFAATLATLRQIQNALTDDQQAYIKSQVEAGASNDVLTRSVGASKEAVIAYADSLRQASAEGATSNQMQGVTAEKNTELNRLRKEGESVAKAHAAALQHEIDAFRGLNPKVDESIAAIRRIISAGDANTDTVNRMVGALDKLHAAHTKIPDDLERWRQANQTLSGTTTLWQLGIGQLNTQVPDLSGHARESAQSFEELGRWIPPLISTSNQYSDGLSVMGDTLDVSTQGFVDLINVVPAGTKVLADARNTTEQLSTCFDQLRISIGGVNLGPLLKQFDQFLSSPWMSGLQPTSKGGKLAMAGVSVGAGILANATNEPETKGGQLANEAAKGASYGAAFGPYGAIIGAGVGLVVGALKVNPEELAARKSLEDFQEQFGTLKQTIEAVGASYAQYGKSGADAERDLKAALDASHVSAEAEAKALQKINDVLAQGKQRTADVASSVKAIGPAFSDVVAGAGRSREALDDLGQQAVLSFSAQVAAGASVSEAMAVISPALATLKQSYSDLGIEVGDVALKNLLMQNTVVSGNPVLVKAISGLSSEMAAMQKLGIMNVDAFSAMERTGTQMYQRLQAQVATVGGSTRDALIPMQSYLHDAANEAANLGVPLDDNTQMLIDQSKELLIWKETGKDATKALTDSMSDLVAKVSELVDRLAGKGGVVDAIASIPRSVDITVTTHRSDAGESGSVDGASTGGFVTSRGIQHFADGGFVPRAVGTDTVPAMLTPGELVLNKSQQKMLFGGASNDALHAEVRGLRADHANLHRLLKIQGDRLQTTIGTLPIMMQSALRGLARR